ncbi:MAG: HD domain-containing protein [bacterium]|nr:HD domain-containing protein [bacterium]
MNKKIVGIIDFIKKAEKLKTELRHAWTSEVNRQESVAEHTWSSCLLAMTLFDEISIKVDQLRVLKMIIVHDLAEAVVGDIPVFEVSKRQDDKLENEKKAIRKIVSSLDNRKSADEIIALWEEFEERKTPEAMLAKACDKFDVLLQHLNTDIKTWDKGDYKQNPYDNEYRFNFDSFIRELKDKVNFDIMKALEDAGLLDKVSEEQREMWKRQKTDKKFQVRA